MAWKWEKNVSLRSLFAQVIAKTGSMIAGTTLLALIIGGVYYHLNCFIVDFFNSRFFLADISPGVTELTFVLQNLSVIPFQKFTPMHLISARR